MNTIVKPLILAAVPERESELEKLWNTYSPQFNLEHDKPEFSLKAGNKLILFTNRTMRMQWILGFAAWKAFYAYSAHFVWHKLTNGLFDAALINSIPYQVHLDKEYDMLIDSIKELLNVEHIKNYEWPEGVPMPEDGKPEETEGAATFDLNCIATAYTFLHEVHHLKLANDKTTLTKVEEELECDRFAREFMFEKIHEYADSSGYSLDGLKMKRGMSICLASFFLLVITPKKLRGGKSETHPSIAARISNMVDFLSMPDNDFMWTYLACVVLAQLRYEKQTPEAINFTTQKDLCIKLISYLPS